jgi:hypothetical protein
LASENLILIDFHQLIIVFRLFFSIRKLGQWEFHHLSLFLNIDFFFAEILALEDSGVDEGGQ